MKQVNETLYGEPKNGKVKQWKVFVSGCNVIVEWGRLGGKLQTKTTICTPKNVGRSNETTAEQQALLEAEAKWKKQVDKYYRPSIEEALESTTEGVMLAHDFLKQGHRVDEEFYVSKKLDGLRCKSVLVGDSVELHSRGGKKYPIPPHLEKDLVLLHSMTSLPQLDGELYIHGPKLQHIVSATKKHNTLTPMLEYHIFDVPVEGVVWEDRLVMLEKVKECCSSIPNIFIVDNELADKESLNYFQQKYREQGYEGVMLRNKKGLYEFNNKRSSDLQKYKLFQDSEALVVDCTEDKNGEGVLHCKWNNKEFKCKMKGTHSERLYEKQKELVGSWINFTYQEVSEDGVPIFPVGQYVRECVDGIPVE